MPIDRTNSPDQAPGWAFARLAGHLSVCLNVCLSIWLVHPICRFADLAANKSTVSVSLDLVRLPTRNVKIESLYRTSSSFQISWNTLKPVYNGGDLISLIRLLFICDFISISYQLLIWISSFESLPNLLKECSLNYCWSLSASARCPPRRAPWTATGWVVTPPN